MTQQPDESKSISALKVWRAAKTLMVIAAILGLGSLNILTLINDQAHAAGVSFLRSVLAPALAEATMSRLLSNSPTEKYRALENSHSKLKMVSTARSQAAMSVSKRIARRAKANAVKNVAAYLAEIVPIVGVPAITALTISDLYDDCQMLKDINELNVAFEEESTEEVSVCGIKFP